MMISEKKTKAMQVLRRVVASTTMGEQVVALKFQQKCPDWITLHYVYFPFTHIASYVNQINHKLALLIQHKGTEVIMSHLLSL